MISHKTVGISATETRAGVNTLLVRAGLLPAALVVDDTLRPAGGRGPLVAGVTAAHRGPTVGLTGGVRTTG